MYIIIQSIVPPHLTLSGLLHEEPAAAEGAQGHDDEAGEGGRTSVRVVHTELLQSLPCLHHTHVLQWGQTLGALQQLKGGGTFDAKTVRPVYIRQK